MIFEWVDYCNKYEDEIEAWNNDEFVKRYVTEVGTKKDYLMYLSDERFKEFEHNKGYFCKVVLEGKKIIAVLMVFRSENIPTTIEHFIVNPQLCLSSKKYSVCQRKHTAPHQHRI